MAALLFGKSPLCGYSWLNHVQQRMLPTTQFSKSLATAVTNGRCTLKGIQDEKQDEVLCALEK